MYKLVSNVAIEITDIFVIFGIKIDPISQANVILLLQIADVLNETLSIKFSRHKGSGAINATKECIATSWCIVVFPSSDVKNLSYITKFINV